MVLGISSFTYGWAVGIDGGHGALNEQDLVAQTRTFGLACLQIGDNLPLHMMDSPRFSALRNAIHENNIRLEVGARGLMMILEELLLDAMYTLPSQKRIKEFVINPPGTKRGQGNDRGTSGGVAFSADKEQRYRSVKAQSCSWMYSTRKHSAHIHQLH